MNLNTPCKLWTGVIQSDGYGSKWITNDKGKKNWYPAHRWVYEQAHGKLPKNLVVRHMCHNRACVNLDHLQSGTKKDNSQDMVHAGRSAKGMLNAKCLHDDAKIAEIYALRDLPRPYGQVKKWAEKYGLDRTTFYKIWKGNYR